jgi:hypothetical protein
MTEARTALPFVCSVGSAVVLPGNATLYLSGAFVFEEDGDPISALLFGSGPDAHRSLFVAKRLGDSVVFLEEWADMTGTDSAAALEPPYSLEGDSCLFTRTRRLPVHVRALGECPSPVGDTAIVAEYEATTGQRAVIVHGGLRRAGFRGDVLGPGMFDVL